MTDVHEAASNGDLLQLEDAIKQGQNPDEPDIDWGRRTPLHVACAVGSKKCVYVLLNKGCKPNSKTDTGWTPAHFACEGGHAPCLQLLLNNECDITAMDNYGDTPLRVAERHNHHECIKMIREHNNPTEFSKPFKFEVTFDCAENLPNDLEWKIIYVGSASCESYDQVLDSVLVGPVPQGRHKFLFEAASPDFTKIPSEDLVGVTVVLLTCSYRDQEFVRIGYYVNNEYTDQELIENPPSKPIFEKLQRNILTSSPRVTKFKINWD